MCGIVGYLRTNQQQKNILSAFRDLIVADSVRGMHSTGAWWMNSDTKSFYFKEPVTGAQFAHEYIGRGGMIPSTPVAMIGHNRHATIGAITAETAHPFNYSNLTGVHNGTIRGFRHYFKDHIKETDSASLYAAMNDTDADDKSVTKFLSEIRAGSYALVWYESREGSMIRMARNGDRPLSLAKANGTWFWASEAVMLSYAIMRAGLEMEVDPFSIPTETLISIPLDGKGDARAEKYEVKKYFASGVQGHGTDRWPHQSGAGYGGYYGSYGAGSYYSGTYQSTKWNDEMNQLASTPINGGASLGSVRRAVSAGVTEAIVEKVCDLIGTKAMPYQQGSVRAKVLDVMPRKDDKLPLATITHTYEHLSSRSGGKKVCGFIKDKSKRVWPVILTLNPDVYDEVAEHLDNDKAVKLPLSCSTLFAHRCGDLSIASYVSKEMGEKYRTVKMEPALKVYDCTASHPVAMDSIEWSDWQIMWIDCNVPLDEKEDE